MRDDTDWHMHYPRAGDCFVEHGNSVAVVDTGAGGVTVVEVVARQPRQRFFKTTEEFRRAYTSSRGDYFVRYQGNNRRER